MSVHACKGKGTGCDRPHLWSSSVPLCSLTGETFLRHAAISASVLSGLRGATVETRRVSATSI